MTLYRIHTVHGYYYTTSNGRYGRFNGDKLNAAVLCENHAGQQVNSLNEIAPELEANTEVYPGHTTCMACKRQR